MDKIQSLRNTIGGNYSKPKVSDMAMFRSHLSEYSIAMDYLHINRNLSDETIKSFMIGYDYYRNNIAMPESKNGELVNIGYRSLEQDPKIKYQKERGCENWIFNERALEIAKKKQGILIVSNQFDCMSAWQAGFENVVSVPVGKGSYGEWIELFDTIPKVYIAFENTKQSKKFALDLAERIGTDKSYEVIFPEDIVDCNHFFKQHDSNEFKDLIREARPFYKYKFQGLRDVIDSIKEKTENVLKIKCIPFVEFEQDWLTILSGSSNIGKTSIGLNIASELAERGIPNLVLPFERGIRTVGKRFLQVHLHKAQGELDAMADSDWDKVLPDLVDLPLYFSVPSREEIKDTVAKAKKLFNIKVIIVDHLDYLVRKSNDNHNVETSNTLQEFKSLAQEHNIIFIIIHHIKKQEGVGGVTKKPKMEDLKGSSSIYQDPEAVIMLSSPDKGQLEVDIVKNKGAMGSRIFEFNLATGVVGKDITDIPSLMTAEVRAQKGFESF
jgi:hypothetical protein